jgi:hypothetical protein
MMILSKFHSIVGRKSADVEITPAEDPNAIKIRADDKEAVHAPINEITIKEDEKPAEDAQAGVRKIEAVTLTWGRGSMFTVLILYETLPSMHAAIGESSY